MLKGRITAVLMPSVIIPKDRTIATVSPDSPEMAENANVSKSKHFLWEKITLVKVCLRTQVYLLNVSTENVELSQSYLSYLIPRQGVKDTCHEK